MKRKIQIGDSKYKIIRQNYIRDWNGKIGKIPDDIYAGNISYETKLIKIVKYGKRMEERILFHEIAHGIMHELVITCKSSLWRFILTKLYEKEEFVDCFSAILRKTFKLK